ncbi:MAG: Serine/threonine-protein kinase pkn1 [Candidatus Accumulibacter adjunctus]|uniref:Serine/threonine-protein kinase pkn1 n=1 Tax=Candidatus Accumulibacter adjunctus TaxID=1454001 RepID=A0A011NLQ9_9PROT|nr:MAG: Serine/threonine-protein kinase pkn1 [Candidatus Accumulibacter adjunctus]
MNRTTPVLLAAAFAVVGGLPAVHASDVAASIEMVRVPGGCYPMGNTGYEKHELPVHEVCVDSFEIGKYEITQGQWNAVMGTKASKFDTCGDTCPVDQVSWLQSQEFIRKLNAQGRGGFRLPTEAEWEYACRSGGKQETWPGGVSADQVFDIAWFNKASAGERTHPVGTKRPNGLGIHDMAGNVWEWVQDKFVSPYPVLPKENPRIETGGEEKRVMRGGSWGQKVNYVRCGIRSRYEPEFVDVAGRVGLRVVRDTER